MYKKNKAHFNVFTLLTIGTLLFLGITTFILSSNFSTIVTPFGPLGNIFATIPQPQLTQGFTDEFKTDSVNEEIWDIVKTGDTTLTQTAGNRLKIEVPAGNTDGKAKIGSLVSKQVMDDRGDFRILVVVNRPVVTGQGMGVAGIRFSSSGDDDDEGAVVQWRVNGSASKVSFVVRSADGTKLESNQEDLVSTVAVLRLDRINRRYIAYYKVGNNLTADTSWKRLGGEWNATLGNEGKVSLFVHNSGWSDKYPKVIARFDTARVRWEGEEATTIGFSDAFANGIVGKNWRETKTDDVVIRESARDNLVFALQQGPAQGGFARRATLVRTNPVIPEGKDFRVSTTLYKPNVEGVGTGSASLRFVSAGNIDDEASAVRWVIGSNGTNRVVFLTRAPDGTVAERAHADIPANTRALTLRLVRNGTRYAGAYRIGDGDAEFVTIGEAESSNFGANGRISLNANNSGAGRKFPKVTARFDHVTGSVDK